MTKKLSLFKSWLLLLFLMVGSSVAWAQSTSTLTFSAKCNGSGTADDGVVWSVTSDGTESNYDQVKGIHYGTTNAQVTYIQLSTSDISGTITKVVVNASTASGVTASVGVTVGGSAFGGDAKSLTSSAADYTFEGSAQGEIVVNVAKPSKAAKALYVMSVTVTYTTGGSSPTPSISADNVNITYDATLGEIGYTINNGVANASLSATTTASWISNFVYANNKVTFSAEVNDAAERTATVTLNYNNGATVLATKDVTVTQAGNPNAPGTENNPYTVAQARAAIDAGTGVTGVYATGIVSKIVTAYNSQYGNISYNISEDGTETADQLQAYRGFSYNGNWFTSEDDIKVGDVVVVYGNLTKYGDTYEFAANNQLVSLDRPAVTNPTITASPTSLTGFTYVEGSGPSAAQQLTIGGLNQTDGSHANLDDNSCFEYSFMENDGYSSDTGIGTQANDNVIIYVRLKSGLPVGDYTGAITITSQGAETVTVNLSGSVTAAPAPNVTWDLSVASYDQVTDPDVVTWSSTCVTMTNTKGSSSTSPSNYLGGDSNNRTSSRFYNGNNLIITPATGYSITSVEFTATSENYASALANSTWTNATAAASGTTVTVTPTNGANAVSAAIGGTCGFTSVTVYYEAAALSAPVWALPAPEITVGDDYEIYLTQYVTGNPTPAITLTNTTADTNDYVYDPTNGYLYFLPSSAGTFDFTFKAENSEGTVEEILSILVNAPAASIVVNETTINIAADETTSYVIIPVTYTNITNVVANVQFYEADGVTPLTSNPYTWITVGTSGTDFAYQIKEENTNTEPRTVYCKVWAYDDANNPVYSELITITQAGLVVPAADYATLPFNWAGGASADFEALDGVTANGLGSDYAAGNAPYLIKFDGDGDYIQVKTDSQPGVVSIDVKMLGGANSSTITVQGSADGTTFTDVEALEISGKQNDVLTLKTTQAFGDNDRYVRLLFTKGSNVGVGAISIAKPVAPSTDPIINVNASDIELSYDATSGEIEYYITNPVVGTALNATTTATWISNISISDDKVTFTTTANDGDADRSATITLSYQGATDKNVTVTQKHFVKDYATLPFCWEGGASADFLALDGVTANGLGGDYAASNAPYLIKFDGDGDYIKVKTDKKPLNVTIDVKMLGGGNKSTITVQGSADGTTFADVEELTISGKQNDVLNLETTNAFADTDRYVRLLFEKGSNVGVGAITINCVRKAISAAGYATYCSPYALDFSSFDENTLIAYEATISGSSVTFVGVNVQNTTAADKLFAAGEGMLLQGTEGTYTIPVIASATENTNNKFVGTVTGEQNVPAGIFVLMNQNNKVGFYKTTNPFTVGAHTAYLPALPGSSSARDYIWFGDDTTTGIGNLNLDLNDNNVYNLQGQRVNKAQKGLYIVNGKKVVLK